ncbi:glycosyl hydrolase [Fusarium tricinctum]|uniref:Glycosyl hydrolase n=1 Tax=Fusarium tricinctum TaxID=61284 RepID=A0A8K0SDA5_9HYPO|nr:glycosyl hydrolase [Fusarium tricinctum]
MLLAWLLYPILALGGALPEKKTDVSTYTNPVLPGWHSDPSCIQKDGLFLCVTSTFISFPGLPVYASKDLINWRLISHVWSREKQLPGISWKTQGQQQGMYAATIRFHKGFYYVICEYLGVGDIIGVIFKTTDPFNQDSWSDPVTFKPTHIDPDLFWDDDGKVYCATHGVTLQEINLETGKLGPEMNIWNGTGGVWPEGPHIYKRDGYYYLMIAEGGTAEDHAITIARARKITGPYEGYENNPILTNRGTSEYFQTVGHGDLFQDTKGNWWGLCLATRLGKSGVAPMGREAVLFNATWEKGEWPVLQPVRGRMPGNLLPKPTRNVPGKGPFNSDPDNYNLKKTKEIPPHFVHHRVPREGTFSLSSKGMHIVPSRNNVTGSLLSRDKIELSGQRGLAFIGRRQTDTLFKFSIDLDFAPKKDHQEAGITIFRTQFDHIDLGIVRLPPKEGSNKKSKLAFRFRAMGPKDVPKPKIVPVPSGWEKGGISLHIETVNATHYNFKASSDQGGKKLDIATASASLVSGGMGSFVGSLVGAYATCNGEGSGLDCPKGGDAYVSKWTYKPVAQEIDFGVFV